MNTKICSECDKEFTPQSRHRKCPKCRRESLKIPCPLCGSQMKRTATSCRTCVPNSGPNNPNWRDGRIRSQKGYISVYSPDHPKVKPTNKYISEHVLVMEEFLGRYLVSGENVHHKYGIKDDNRIENLELWTKPQPTGIRASDAYLHALSVIELYEKDYKNGKLV